LEPASNKRFEEGEPTLLLGVIDRQSPGISKPFPGFRSSAPITLQRMLLVADEVSGRLQGALQKFDLNLLIVDDQDPSLF
jgi:hypothetical protein